MDSHGLVVEVNLRERYKELERYVVYRIKQKKQVELPIPSIRVSIQIRERFEALSHVPNVQQIFKPSANRNAPAHEKLSSTDLPYRLCLQVLGIESSHLEYKELRRIISSKAIRNPLHLSLEYLADVTACCATCGMETESFSVVRLDMNMCLWCMMCQDQEAIDHKAMFKWKVYRQRNGEIWLAPRMTMGAYDLTKSKTRVPTSQTQHQRKPW